MGWMGTSSTLPLMYGILLIDERGIALSYWRSNCGRFDQACVYCGRISPVIFMFCFFGISSHAAPPKLISGTARQGPPGPRPLLLHQPPARGHNLVTLLRILILSASWLPTTSGVFHLTTAFGCGFNAYTDFALMPCTYHDSLRRCRRYQSPAGAGHFHS